MTPAEYGRHLAQTAPPLTPEQIETAARILAAAEECAPDPARTPPSTPRPGTAAAPREGAADN